MPPAARLLALLCACAAAVLALAGPALADTASISFTDAAGKVDPAADVGRTWTVTGNTTTPKRFFIKWRAAGGAPCAPSAGSDSGTANFGSFSGDDFYSVSVNGDFTRKKTGTWDTPGTYLFCMWLADNDAQSVTPISQTVTFRAATGTISGAISPATPKIGDTITVTATGSSEAPKRVFAKVRPAGGAPCAVSFDADSGRGILASQNVNGSFNVSDTWSTDTGGDYVVCLWLADSSSDGSPVAGPQPFTFSVAAPPPPPPACVVPAITPGSTLDVVDAALTGANCTRGGRKFIASKTYARGTVIKLLTATGTSLANAAPVGLLVSSGAPCRVPAARRGMSLALAKSRLVTSGCAVGKVRRVRSTRRRGTVVRFAPSSGARLAPRTVVTIVLSRGRR